MGKLKRRRRGERLSGSPAAVAGVGGAQLAAAARPRRWAKGVPIGLVAGASPAGAAIPLTLRLNSKPTTTATAPPGPPPARSGEPAAVTPAYVASAPCTECHPAQHQQWAGSHHDRAMQSATTETVRGD